VSILPIAAVLAALMLITIARQIYVRRVLGFGGYGPIPGWGEAVLVLALFSGAMLTWNTVVEPNLLWAAVWAVPTLLSGVYVLLSLRSSNER
jgi:hypothetical protein